MNHGTAEDGTLQARTGAKEHPAPVCQEFRSFLFDSGGNNSTAQYAGNGSKSRPRRVPRQIKSGFLRSMGNRVLIAVGPFLPDAPHSPPGTVCVRVVGDRGPHFEYLGIPTEIRIYPARLTQ